MAIVDNRVFINNIPLTATKDDLSAHFGQFGTTVDVFTPLRFGSQQHKGMCFVTYTSADSVQAALNHPGGHVIHGKAVTVEFCLPKDKGEGKGGKASFPGKSNSVNGDRLFITKVPPDATKEEVEALFSKFGQWTDVFMPSGNFPAGHKGICFISYMDPQSAQLAITCGPHQLQGQDLVVELATPRDVKGCGKVKGPPTQQQYAPPVQQPVAAWPAAAPAYPSYQQPNHHAWPAAAPVQQVWQAAAGIPHYQQAPQVVHPRQPATTVGLKPGRLFCTKVPDDVTKEDLNLYFQQYGQIEDVFVPTGKSIAFVSFSDSSTSAQVVQTPEHEVKVGRYVTVDLAYDRPPVEAKGKGKFRFQPYN